MNKTCKQKCPLRSSVAKWFYGTGFVVLLSFASWAFYQYRDFFTFKVSTAEDIAEQKIMLREIKATIEAGNKENLQRDIDLKLWMTRLDQKLNDRNETNECS